MKLIVSIEVQGLLDVIATPVLEPVDHLPGSVQVPATVGIYPDDDLEVCRCLDNGSIHGPIGVQAFGTPQLDLEVAGTST